jgi:hypothetical protein
VRTRHAVGAARFENQNQKTKIKIHEFKHENYLSEKRCRIPLEHSRGSTLHLSERGAARSDGHSIG